MYIFIASSNKNKIDEIKNIFSNYKNLNFISKFDGIGIPDVVEDGETFEQNSLKKALHISRLLEMPCIADDSGLVVEALNGEPGVYSARYSESGKDEDNNKKLIEKLKGVENRRAKFVCVITYANKEGRYVQFRGELEGTIIDEARGENGFGYDPHFFVEKYGKTLAEMPEIKNEISHRAIALQKFKDSIYETLLEL